MRKQRKPEKLPWSTYEKQGEIRGCARGKALAQKYIAALEATWGSRPTTPKKLAAACGWIEEKALEELLNDPGWDSIKLTIYRHSPNTVEGRALDLRIWDAFQRAAVCAIRATLTAYGCANLRFLDMTSFVRYYRASEEG